MVKTSYIVILFAFQTEYKTINFFSFQENQTKGSNSKWHHLKKTIKSEKLNRQILTGKADDSLKLKLINMWFTAFNIHGLKVT